MKILDILNSINLDNYSSSGYDIHVLESDYDIRRIIKLNKYIADFTIKYSELFGVLNNVNYDSLLYGDMRVDVQAYSKDVQYFNLPLNIDYIRNIFFKFQDDTRSDEHVFLLFKESIIIYPHCDFGIGIVDFTGGNFHFFEDIINFGKKIGMDYFIVQSSLG